MSVEPPHVPVGAGWRRVEESVDTPFDVRVVTVTAATRVWEDETTQRAIRESADVDRTWRFFFATRIVLRPASRPSKALRAVVTDRALDGFEDRLRDRGFESVARRESREFSVGEERATLARHEAVSRVAALDASLAVEGYAAVWPVGNEFRLAGGAYPTGVRTAGGDGGRNAAADANERDADERVARVHEALEPERFRTDLLELIRRVE
mgnify:CR=1 FL=1